MTVDTLDARTLTISPHEAAQRIGLTEGTLRNMRVRGDGPRYCRVGRRVRYRLVDLAAYLDSRTRTSTSDDGSHA